MFDKTYLDYSEKELIMIYDELVRENVPKGKSIDDYSGAYLQMQKSQIILVLFYGYSESKNPVSARVKIDSKEVDLIYLMMKAKVISKDAKTENLTKRLLDKRERWEEIE